RVPFCARSRQQCLSEPHDARLLPGTGGEPAVLHHHRFRRFEPAPVAGVRVPVDRDRHDVRAARPSAHGHLSMPAATLREALAPPQGRPHPAPRLAAGRKPHVCFVAPYAWPVLARDPAIQVVGGAEVQQSILARLLAAAGYRVSMITLDHGQPSPVMVDGISVHKAFSLGSGIPVVRFLHPRLTTMWQVLGEVDADVYYQRSSAMWTGVVAQFCRRHGKRSIFAGASDRDFEIGQEQIHLARDRWLYRWGVAHVDRVIAQNAFQLESCRRNHRREALVIPSCYAPPPHAQRATLANDRVLWVG